MIENLTYELSVLAKAVQHKNLSAASAHIGLSQPQLSRLVARLEGELKVILLDRSARRKSGWTPIASDLAMAFTKGMGRIEADLLAMSQDREITHLRVGTLEGLSMIACQFVKSSFEELHFHQINLDVLDFKDLDSQFLGGDLDLIFTVRSPSKQKFSHSLEVGFQQMEKVSSDSNIHVVSPYEFAGLDRSSKSTSQTLVSNSLSLREYWLKNIGGSGVLPTDAKKGRGKGYYTIYLIGSELLSPKIWEKITALF